MSFVTHHFVPGYLVLHLNYLTKFLLKKLPYEIAISLL
jgi:hypothetical protein